MIRVTEKYGIDIMPECYAVTIIFKSETEKSGSRNMWFYATFEEALIKISRLIEKDRLVDVKHLDEAIKALHELHMNGTFEMIRAAGAATGIPEK